jgi:sulfhydrogenase subunit alpha
MKTQVISIDHLTRVEGNGGISATIDGKVVTDVQFKIFEGPRLVEKLAVGRTPEEDVSMSPRICAICTVSHKNAVVRAMENALGVKVAPETIYTRELMHMGEQIESHSLHTFLLALPDYLGYPNAIAMAADYGFEAKIGLEMKNFGNRIMELYNGRYIHGENALIGGFGKLPSREDLLWIKSRAQQFMPFVHKTVSLFCELPYPEIPEEDTLFACCDPGNDSFGFWGEEILCSNGDRFGHDQYRDLTNEFVVPHSFCKRSRYQGKPFQVGALARVNVLGERLKGDAGEYYKKYFNPHWTRNPLYINAAQALELVYCFERIPQIVDYLLQHSGNPPLVAYDAKEGTGTGFVEAPRGLLVHHYQIKNGLVTHADIITPTAMNAEEIEKYAHIAAQKLLDMGQEDQIRDRMDIVVRAFDPCISCSAHVVEIKKAPEGDWRNRLDQLGGETDPIFIGVGNPDRRDDAAGLEMANSLRERGITDVWLQSEISDAKAIWQEARHRPIVFLDTVNFEESAGKITLIPLRHVLENASNSHKFVPFLDGVILARQLGNSYVLGIQPDSVDPGQGLSDNVRSSMNSVIEYISRKKEDSKALQN